MFNIKMKIGTKITALVSGMIVALLAVGGVSIFLMQEIGDELDEIAKADMPLSRHVTEIAINPSRTGGNLRADASPRRETVSASGR